MGKISLKLRKAKKGNQRKPQYDVGKLKEPAVKKMFQLELRNRFSILQDEQELDIDNFNQALLHTSDNILGPKRKRKEEWISNNTWKKIDERKEVKQKILHTRSHRLKEQLKATYSILDKDVKKN